MLKWVNSALTIKLNYSAWPKITKFQEAFNLASLGYHLLINKHRKKLYLPLYSPWH